MNFDNNSKKCTECVKRNVACVGTNSGCCKECFSKGSRCVYTSTKHPGTTNIIMPPADVMPSSSRVGNRMEELVVSDDVQELLDSVGINSIEQLNDANNSIIRGLVSYLTATINPLYEFCESLLSALSSSTQITDLITMSPNLMADFMTQETNGVITNDVMNFVSQIGGGKKTPNNQFGILRFLSQGTIDIVPRSYLEANRYGDVAKEKRDLREREQILNRKMKRLEQKKKALKRKREKKEREQRKAKKAKKTDYTPENFFALSDDDDDLQNVKDSTSDSDTNSDSEDDLLLRKNMESKQSSDDNAPPPDFNLKLLKKWRQIFLTLSGQYLTNIGTNEDRDTIGFCFLTPRAKGLINNGHAQVVEWVPQLGFSKEELITTPVIYCKFASLCAYINGNNNFNSLSNNRDNNNNNNSSISFNFGNGRNRQENINAMNIKNNYIDYFKNLVRGPGNKLMIKGSSTQTYQSGVYFEITER